MVKFSQPVPPNISLYYLRLQDLGCRHDENCSGFIFLRSNGSKRGTGDWEISFKFVASPNATGLSVGNITGITKAGWDYLWVRYEDAEDTAAKALVKRPVAAYVERVYPWGNFSSLGIGV